MAVYDVNNVLRKISNDLDISPRNLDKISVAVEEIRQHVEEGYIEGMYPNSLNSPIVYLQGSMSLGTAIKPLNSNNDDYDVDLVVEFSEPKEDTSPCGIKKQLHRKLESGAKGKLKGEGRRCWTLEYSSSSGSGFHMDLLPAVKESADKILELKKDPNTCGYADYAIAISDKRESGYGWETSNPIGYTKWFKEQNEKTPEDIILNEKAIIVADSMNEGLFASAEDVTDFYIRSPLKRVIQILKRHRDMRFNGNANEKYKPISIIITTLCADIYNGERTIEDTMNSILAHLDKYAPLLNDLDQTAVFDSKMLEELYRIRKVDGKWWVGNPTNSKENFADKWHEDENENARAKAFFQWIKWVRSDLIDIAETLDEEGYYKSLNESLVGKKGFETPESRMFATARNKLREEDSLSNDKTTFA